MMNKNQRKTRGLEVTNTDNGLQVKQNGLELVIMQDRLAWVPENYGVSGAEDESLDWLEDSIIDETDLTE